MVEVVKKTSAAYSDRLVEDEFSEATLVTAEWTRSGRLPAQTLSKVLRLFTTADVTRWSFQTYDWTDKDDISTQGSLLEKEEAEVHKLIFQIKSFSCGGRLAKRLVALFKYGKEEDSASSGISVNSLRNFYNFLRLYSNLKHPAISLTRDYNVYV